MATARWRIVASSVAGTSHLEKAIPCQDAHAFRILPGGALLAAVSDGAGSAAHAEEGAHMAVEHALASLETICQRSAPDDEAGWQVAVAGLFAETHQALADFASAAGVPLREFATTLTCALVTGEWLVVGQIGDGAAVVQGEVSNAGTGDLLYLAAQPQRGEYANEAYFLTRPDAGRCATVLAAHRSVQALALMTDGLLRLAFKLPAYEPHLGFFQPLFTFGQESEDEAQAQDELADFLVSDRVCARCDDDKTLLLAVRLDQAAGQAHRRKARRRKDVCV